MVKKKVVECACPVHPKSVMVIKGVLAILLGLSLWMEYLSLSQVFAIVFVLIGLVVLFHYSKK